MNVINFKAKSFQDKINKPCNNKIIFYVHRWIKCFLCFIGPSLLSQVGINTQNPLATLDINGNMKIRTSLVLPTAELLDKIMVFDSNNVVHNVDINRVFNSSPLVETIVKGVGGTGFSVTGLNLMTGWQKVTFPTIEIDEGINYNTGSQEFIVPETGIYNVSFYIEMASLLSASVLGAGIIKTDGVTNVRTLLSEESFLNVSVLGINVSSPIRKTQTIVKLNQGDKVVFGMKVPLADISLFANSKALFTIWRMK